MKKTFIKYMGSLLLLFIILPIHLLAQNTVGTISHNPDLAYDGYNLFFPHSQATVWLTNNCGEVVHKWEDENPDMRPGNTVHLLENGNLVACKRSASITGDPIWAGGGGATIEIRDWDNNLLWTMTQNNDSARLHHDIAVKPDGNILAIAWVKKTYEEAVAVGRDTAQLDDGELWSESIVEIEPVGSSDFNIVWRWDAWDHLVQDYNESLPNYGVIADNPNKIDINYPHNSGVADWLHMNGVDYFPFYDQIMLCVPTFNEVWIIDRSTTTEQASSSTGGNSGKGGDLIFRWGNNAAFDKGTEADQKFFYQHDAHWADISLNSANPDFGKIVVFNNRIGSDFSAASIVAPIYTSYDSQYAMEDGVFLPNDYDWHYTAPTPQDMFSNILSGMQVLPNNNRLICVGRTSFNFEVTPDGEIVWEYKIPLQGGFPVEQGSDLPTNANLNFKTKRYGTDYAAFEGRDLTPQAYIELNPEINAECALVGINDQATVTNISLMPNPFSDALYVNWVHNNQTANAQNDAQLRIFNAVGQLVHQQALNTNQTQVQIATQNWAAGLYFVQLNNQHLGKVMLQP